MDDDELSAVERGLLELARRRGFVVVTERPRGQARSVEVVEGLARRGLLVHAGQLPAPRRQKRVRYDMVAEGG